MQQQYNMHAIRISHAGAWYTASILMQFAYPNFLLPITYPCAAHRCIVRAHHPRINQASQLIRQITAALRLQPYQEPKQQQQQRSHEAAQRGSSSSNSTSSSAGHLRYIQLTALPSDPGGRAENDPQAQVQVKGAGGGIEAHDKVFV